MGVGHLVEDMVQAPAVIGKDYRVPVQSDPVQQSVIQYTEIESLSEKIELTYRSSSKRRASNSSISTISSWRWRVRGIAPSRSSTESSEPQTSTRGTISSGRRRRVGGLI